MANKTKSTSPTTEQRTATPVTRRLAEYGKINRDARAVKLDDLVGTEVTITSFRIVKGKFGDFAFMDLVLETGEAVAAICGGQFVLDALQDAQAKRAFPVVTRFYRRGNAWMFE